MPGRPAPAAPTTPWARVYGTAETLLDVFGDPVIAASAEGCDLDLDELLTGANNTLYLYAPASEQERLRPLFELLVSRGDLQGRAAGRRPTRRHARPPAVRVPGRGRQLRRHQEAPPAGHHRPGPGHPAADHLARRGPAPAPLRPPRLHRPERPSGQAAAVRPGRPGLPRAGHQAGRRRGRHPDLGDHRRGRPGLADRVDGLSAAVAAGGAAAAQAPAGPAGVWASAAGPDPAAALVPLPPPGHPGHGRGRRRAAPGHGRRRPGPGRAAAADGDEGEAAA